MLRSFRRPFCVAVIALALTCATAAKLLPPLKPPANATNVTLTSVTAALKATAPRVLGDVTQVDVPFNYDAYFNTYLTSNCYPANTYSPTPSTGFPGSCPGTLPWSDPRLAAPATPCTPEQVALKWWGTAVGGPAVVVSWTTCPAAYVLSGPVPPADPAAAPSVVWLGKAPGVYDETFQGVSTTYTVDYNTLLNGTAASPPGGVYRSPYVHHVRVGPLVPGVEYFYLVEGPPGTQPFTGQFKAPGGFPTRVAAISDPGQTANTSSAFSFLQAAKPDLLLMPGDLTYADNNEDWNMFYDWTMAQAIYEQVNTFSPRWGAFSRLLSPLASRVPVITAPGNHEIEATPANAKTPTASNNYDNTRFFTRFQNYLARFPVPQTPAQAVAGPSVADLAAITPAETDQGRGLYYATEVPGVATIVSLSSYTFTDNYTPSDPQYKWLDATLAAVDRKKTPWVVVINHVSWYSTGLLHAFEGECMRALYEPLFRKYGVDVVLSGHDHAYERSGPVFNYQNDPDCGTVYLNVGYNGDEVNFGWMDQYAYLLDPANAWQRKYMGYYTIDKMLSCTVPTNPASPTTGGYNYTPPYYTVQKAGQWGTGGSCVTSKVTESGTWCSASMPAYSRWREDVFGAGWIDFESPTKAVWNFYSQGTAMVKPADSVVITRGSAKCPAAGAAAPANVKASLMAAVNSTLTAKAAGGALDLVAGVTGVKRGVESAAAAKVATANWTVTTWANALRNKTGGVV